MPINFLADSVGENIAKAMTSNNLWIAICKTVIIIMLGFFLTKKKIFPQGTGKVLTKVVMTVALPCLAFTSFMSDFSVNAASDVLFNFIFGFVIYIFFIFFAKLVFIWVKDKNTRDVLCVLFAFGSTTFFAQPLIQAIFGANAYNNSNLLNIAYRVFLYSYAYVVICTDTKKEAVPADGAVAADGTVAEKKSSVDIGALMKKVFLNPIIIATLAGLILWLLQAIPGVAIVPKNIYGQAGSADAKVAFWRFDVTLPWFFQVAKLLGTLASPLVWLAIGCTLGSKSIKDAATDKMAWIYSGLKVFLAPLVVLGILFLVEVIAKAAGYAQLVSIETVQSAVMMWMVPPATVAVAYCISSDKRADLASDISILSTLVAVVGVVFWVLILTLVQSSGFFPSVTGDTTALTNSILPFLA